MGEDVGRYGGGFGVSLGLLEEFGEERIRDTPLSESGFVGAGIGAALGGMRPIVEIMTVNFSLLALDQILNTAATVLHMSGGQFNVPLVIRMTTGGGRQLAAQHSHSLEGYYAHIPGLRVLAPATVADARGMLWTALQDPDPGDHLRARLALQRVGRARPTDAGAVDIDRAVVRRAGDDLTHRHLRREPAACLQAAELLAAEGIERRGDRPAHAATARRRDGVRRPSRARTGPWSSTRAGAASACRRRSPRGSPRSASTTSTHRWRASPPWRCRSRTPRHLEQAALPNVDRIVAGRARW